MNVARFAICVLIAVIPWGCGPKIEPLTSCPEGARLTGSAPPEGEQQRCMKGGDRHGPSRSWYKNGRVRAETEWWEGTKHGSFTLWYENGQKRAEGEDWHGQAMGTWTYWDEEGNVLQQRSFEPPPEAVAESTAAAGDPPEAD